MWKRWQCVLSASYRHPFFLRRCCSSGWFVLKPYKYRGMQIIESGLAEIEDD